ncbi:MAG: hypothetical protein ACTHK7_03830 [Aureliella sp.]
MARYDDLNTKTIGYITFISVILLATAILLLQALCYNWINLQEDAKLTKQSYYSSDEIIQQQKQSLQNYGKVTEEVPVEPPKDGTQPPPGKEQVQSVERIRIPIERAETLLLEEVNSKGDKSASAPNT